MVATPGIPCGFIDPDDNGSCFLTTYDVPGTVPSIFPLSTHLLVLATAWNRGCCAHPHCTDWKAGLRR